MRGVNTRSGNAAEKNRAERSSPLSTRWRMRCAAAQSCGSCWLFFTVRACGPALSRPSAQGASANNTWISARSFAVRMSGSLSSMGASGERNGIQKRQKAAPLRSRGGKPWRQNPGGSALSELQAGGHLQGATSTRDVVPGVELVGVQLVGDVGEVGLEREAVEVELVFGHQVRGHVGGHVPVDAGGLLFAAEIQTSAHAQPGGELVGGPHGAAVLRRE